MVDEMGAVPAFAAELVEGRRQPESRAPRPLLETAAGRVGDERRRVCISSHHPGTRGRNLVAGGPGRRPLARWPITANVAVKKRGLGSRFAGVEEIGGLVEVRRIAAVEEIVVRPAAISGPIVDARSKFVPERDADQSAEGGRRGRSREFRRESFRAKPSFFDRSSRMRVDERGLHRMAPTRANVCAATRVVPASLAAGGFRGNYSPDARCPVVGPRQGEHGGYPVARSVGGCGFWKRPRVRRAIASRSARASARRASRSARASARTA